MGQQWATMGQQWATMGNNRQQWTAMDNNPRCYMHLWCRFSEYFYTYLLVLSPTKPVLSGTELMTIVMIMMLRQVWQRTHMLWGQYRRKRTSLGTLSREASLTATGKKSEGWSHFRDNVLARISCQFQKPVSQSINFRQQKIIITSTTSPPPSSGTSHTKLYWGTIGSQAIATRPNLLSNRTMTFSSTSPCSGPCMLH